MSQASLFGVPRSAAETAADYDMEDLLPRLDETLDAFLTSHSGPTEPAYAAKGTFWLDTSVTPHPLKFRGDASWGEIATFDPSTSAWNPARAYVLTALGADATGVADSSAAFQAAINDVSSGKTAVITVPAGTYKLNTALSAGSRHIVWMADGHVTLTGTSPFLPGQRRNFPLGIYNLNGTGSSGTALAVQDYYNFGSRTVTSGKQDNVIRFEGEFVGGNDASCIKLDVDFTNCTDGYCVIGAARNKGSGNTKALYGNAISEPGCTGVMVGVVAATEVKSGSTPTTVYNLQLSVNGGGSPTGIWDLIHINTSEGGRVVDHGMVADSDVTFSNAFLKAFNAGAGSFAKWQDSNTSQVIFEVDEAGTIIKRSSTGTITFRASAGATEVWAGSRLRTIEVGSPDSGGSGFRMMRCAN